MPGQWSCRKLRTQPAKATVVIGTLDFTFLWMGIETFISGRTVTILCKPVTLGHAPEVIFMEKLAGITFFAKAAKPMFADGRDTLSIAWVSWQRL